MAFNPGDIVRIVGMQDTLGRPTNEFGGNGGLGTVQGVRLPPQLGEPVGFHQVPRPGARSTSSPLRT